MRILISCIFALCVASIFAEPVAIGTKSEIQTARRVVEDLVQSETSADELLTMAKESTKGAERYWLYANAFILQAKEGKYAEATETIKSLRENVTGIPDTERVGLIGRNAGKELSKVPELEAIHKEAKMRIVAQKLAVRLKQDICKNPKDDALKQSLADALAVCGDWDAALKAYAETKLASATVAKLELANKKSAKIAAFWWDYKPCRTLSAAQAFKVHAAGMYTELIKTDVLSALEKILAEKRIAQLSMMAEVSATEDEQAPAVRNTAATVIKLYNPDKLLHRWTFNNTCMDDVGGIVANFCGNPKLDEHQATIFGGRVRENNIFLGHNLIPSDGSPVTIELWATQNKAENWARIFAYGDFGHHSLDVAWTVEDDLNRSFVHLTDGCEYQGNGLAPFELGKEYHIAIVFKARSKSDVGVNDELWDLTIYKQDAQTGRTIKKIKIPLERGFSLNGFNSGWAHLGLTYLRRREAAASASYNEVRIWNRALDENELTQNAIKFHKAGETIKINK